MAERAKMIRTRVGSSPKRRATPAETPAMTRSSLLRRSGASTLGPRQKRLPAPGVGGAGGGWGRSSATAPVFSGGASTPVAGAGGGGAPLSPSVGLLVPGGGAGRSTAGGALSAPALAAGPRRRPLIRVLIGALVAVA